MATPPSLQPRRRKGTIARRSAIHGEAIRVMRRRIDEPDLVLADVAGEVNTSPRTLQRCFLDRGDSFRDRLERLRMTRALTLMRTGVPPNVIARQVGYRHATHFCTAFRRSVGIPVGEVRAALRVYARPDGGSDKRNVPWRRRAWSGRQKRIHAVAREMQKRGVVGRRPRGRRRLV